MTAAAPAQEPGVQSIVQQVAAARARAHSVFRLKFLLTWIALLGLLGAMLWFTGNINVGHRQRRAIHRAGRRAHDLISVASILLAVVLALFGALGRLSTNPYLNGVASLYVSLVRGTPLLVQIFFVYLALPQLGIILPVVLGGILALGFNYGAYMTEIFRAGIQAARRPARGAGHARA
jgi:polar amino acid transport system permease protein